MDKKCLFAIVLAIESLAASAADRELLPFGHMAVGASYWANHAVTETPWTGGR